MRRRLIILPSHAPQFPAPERLGQLFHLCGSLDLLEHSAIRGVLKPHLVMGSQAAVAPRQANTKPRLYVACIPVSIAGDFGGLSILNMVGPPSPFITI